jgi:hypothetical protein
MRQWLHQQVLDNRLLKHLTCWRTLMWTDSGLTEGDDTSRTVASGSLSNCSRMRRMLFRRTRSETEDRTRNSRVSKQDSTANSTPEQVHSRLNFTPQSAVLEEVSTASTAVTTARLHSLMPRSPPPPYDSNSEVKNILRNRSF